MRRFPTLLVLMFTSLSFPSYAGVEEGKSSYEAGHYAKAFKQLPAEKIDRKSTRLNSSHT